jgi:hypothetical protein
MPKKDKFIDGGWNWLVELESQAVLTGAEVI